MDILIRFVSLKGSFFGRLFCFWFSFGVFVFVWTMWDFCFGCRRRIWYCCGGTGVFRVFMFFFEFDFFFGWLIVVIVSWSREWRGYFKYCFFSVIGGEVFRGVYVG